MNNFIQILRATSNEDIGLINKIIESGVIPVNKHVDILSLEMDIICCHSVYPLDLRRMFDDLQNNSVGSIGHDLAGIHRHWDRKNYKFTDGFRPRYAMS